MKGYIRKLQRIGACREAMDWLREGDYETLQDAWNVCERGDWMLWLLGRQSGEPDSDARKTLCLAICQCVRLALPDVVKGETRPLKAIETTEAWARGDTGVTLDDVRAARRAAEDAADAADDAAVAAAYVAAVAAAYVAAVAAAVAAVAAASPYAYAAAADAADAADDAAAVAAVAAASPYAYAAAADAAAYVAAVAAIAAKRKEILKRFSDIVRQYYPQVSL